MDRWLSGYTRLFEMTELGPVMHHDISLTGFSLRQGEAVFHGVLPNRTLTDFEDGHDWMVMYGKCTDPTLFGGDEVIIRLLECKAKDIMVGQVTCIRASDVSTIDCDVIVQCEGGIQICSVS